jgi:hypothetical protein
MRPLSATEAFSPAIEHTKALLQPFSLKLWLKLGFVAVFAEMGGQFIAPPMGNFNRHSLQTSGIDAVAGGVTPLLVAGIVAAVLAASLIGLLMLYLGSRLQLVLMDLVATRTTFVAPAWQRTASRTWRWIGVKVVCFLVIFAAVAAVAAGPVLLFIHSLSAGNTTQPSPALFGSIALFIVAIVFIVVVAMLAIWTLRDFVLPFILFEDASFGGSLNRAAALIRNQPGSVLFYLFMKFVIGLAGGVVIEICVLLVALAAALPIGGAGFALWFALHNGGTFASIAMYTCIGLLIVFFLIVMFAAVLCIGGAVLIFYQAYALYFLGGRIEQIGRLLQPPPPPLYAAVPVPPFAPA